MPFINEQLAANHDSAARQRWQADGGRRCRFTFDPDTVMALLRERIVGQPTVLAAMDDMLRVLKADIGASDRPLGVQLLVGPTGVGKTEMVRLLAQALHGSADALCRIDMNTLAQEHYAASLTGAPPGYVGSKEGQTLFDVPAIQGSFSKPGLVLFDELEKASPEVIRTLLNVLERGRLRLSAGNREIDFRNALIFMTSNVGAARLATLQQQQARRWWQSPAAQQRQRQALIDQALQQRFDPEFLNRIDAIQVFDPLGLDQVEALLDLALEQLNQRLLKRGARLTLGEGARRHLGRPLDRRFGARDMARRIRNELSPPLARVMIDYPAATLFEARLEQGSLVVLPV
ncbi:chaperone-associated ATPase [Alcanivorax hongdengensis A-11-3]|uniref:Chaperone-associated ATPase n=1 Tax=Alcanivorax hongdengensis A-11-3 TaxID=1177179 RepID=L0WGG3_9GAMM|nr:AAA family ATPase [Alcanivorax hongdengensis]EKF75814.1 chaperone-associated ATPase [Alcanivorax hongdengensis A-11-3]